MDVAPSAVLVGYDGSADSELALDWSEELASQTHRPLAVLISEVDSTQVLEMTADWHESKMSRLESEARDRLKGSHAPAVVVERVPEPATEALIAGSRGAGLVVVGARGHSLLSGMLLGSVSQHLARHAACPVVVVRRPHDPRPRVVVGVDGSPGSRGALEFAAQQADRASSPLVVLHGWRSTPTGHGAESGAPLERRFAQELAVAERILAETVAGLHEAYPDLPVQTEAVPVAPGRCLADASQAASLVVVGSRGRGAFAGMLLGSVSQHVLHHAHCPVAVVR